MATETDKPAASNLTELPMQSKRFIAFVFAMLSWFLTELALIGAYRVSPPAALWFIHGMLITVSGFISAYYLGGQAALDSYVKLASIAADAGVKLEHKGMTIHGANDDPPPPPPVAS